MLIRKLELKDSESFLKMLLKLDAETEYMMYEPGERKSEIEEINSKILRFEESASVILVAEDNNNLVGFIEAERGFAKRIKHSVYLVVGVLQAYRGKGIGTRLFEEIIKWASSNSIVRLELTVMTNNESAISLYKKMGFKIEGTKVKSMLLDGIYVDEYYMAMLLLL